MTKDWTNGIAAILGADGRPVGTAFFVSRQPPGDQAPPRPILVTCAHVIEALNKKQGDEVEVRLRRTTTILQAKILDDWSPPSQLDVAFLEISDLNGIAATPLQLGYGKDACEHEFRTFGYPRQGENDGIEASGTIQGIVAKDNVPTNLRLQLRCNEITTGFSGAPVWDKHSNSVVGMVFEVIEPDKLSRLQDVAIALASESLKTICPQLQLRSHKRRRNLIAGLIFALILVGLCISLITRYFDTTVPVGPTEAASGQLRLKRFQNRIDDATSGALKGIADEISRAEDSASIIALMQSTVQGKRSTFLESAAEPKDLRLEEGRDAHAISTANTVVVLALLGQKDELLQYLDYGPDLRIRSYVINRLRFENLDPISFLPWRMRKPRQAGARQAIVLYLADTTTPLNTAQQEELLTSLSEDYATDLDSGVHSAIAWLYNRWNLGQRLRELDQQLARSHSEAMFVERFSRGEKWEWFLGQNAETMVVFGPTKVEMGLSVSFLNQFNKKYNSLSSAGKVDIPNWFAVSSKPVTKQSFEQFVSAEKISTEQRCGKPEFIPDISSLANDAAVSEVTWITALGYCDWLTYGNERENSGLCAPKKDEVSICEYGGYRLPTEAEWLCACKAGTVTLRCFGFSEALLSDYAWYRSHSGNEKRLPNRVGLNRPNARGLFDMHGNVEEMCLDVWADDYVDSVRHRSYPVWLPLKATFRPIRGGSGNFPNDIVFSAWRDKFNAANGHPLRGFRIAKTLILEKK